MPVPRRVIVVDNSAVARRVGGRIREARVRAGLTQAEVAKGRYTAAYISALERGLAKPSMAALTYIAERLAVPVRSLVGDDESGAARIEADLLLASGRWAEALDAYTALADKTPATDRGRHAELLLGIAEALCRLSRAREAIRRSSGAPARRVPGGSRARVPQGWGPGGVYPDGVRQPGPISRRGRRARGGVAREQLGADVPPARQHGQGRRARPACGRPRAAPPGYAPCLARRRDPGADCVGGGGPCPSRGTPRA